MKGSALGLPALGAASCVYIRVGGYLRQRNRGVLGSDRIRKSTRRKEEAESEAFRWLFVLSARPFLLLPPRISGAERKTKIK